MMFLFCTLYKAVAENPRRRGKSKGNLKTASDSLEKNRKTPLFFFSLVWALRVLTTFVKTPDAFQMCRAFLQFFAYYRDARKRCFFVKTLENDIFMSVVYTEYCTSHTADTESTHTTTVTIFLVCIWCTITSVTKILYKVYIFGIVSTRNARK